MRKNITGSAKPGIPEEDTEWLNLEKNAQVEVSSEDLQHPIESAFKHGENVGWRAAEPGVQTIRLLFDEPKDVRRIWLHFSELEVERTQQFTVRWADGQTNPFKEIVRQQWNFNPRTSAIETEDYRVDLSQVLALELTIDPDLGKGQAYAALIEWRVA